MQSKYDMKLHPCSSNDLLYEQNTQGAAILLVSFSMNSPAVLCSLSSPALHILVDCVRKNEPFNVKN